MALGARRRATAARIYKLSSLLLQYPGEELRASQGEIIDAVRELPRPGSSRTSVAGGHRPTRSRWRSTTWRRSI